MSEMRIGGYGADGCSCSISAGGCPVHHCLGCGEQIAHPNEPAVCKRLPWGNLHPWCQDTYDAKRKAEIEKLRAGVRP